MPAPLRDEHDARDELLTVALGRALWSWHVCSAGETSNHLVCAGLGCALYREPQLQRYLQYYRTTLSIHADEAFETDDALQTRESLLRVVALVKANPTATLSQLVQLAFNDHSPVAPTQVQEDGIRLALKILLMVDSSAPHFFSDSRRLEMGTFRVAWKSDMPLNDYLRNIFPTNNQNVLNYADSEQSVEMTEQLNAINLRRSLGITIAATSDIQNHLRLNRRTNILEVYHFTSFLKEQLRATKNAKNSEYFAGALKLGSLPRQLVLEVLESLQGVLFPIGDKKSKRLLQSLVTTSGFDPDILRVEVRSVRRQGEESVGFYYLAERLTELYEELQSPRPRGRLEQIMERKSGARYVMMATLIGVMLAVLLGIASLGVSSYQTYIAYQAWKHPISPPGT